MTVLLLIATVVATLAGLVCVWAWLICLGRGAERLAARPAAIFAVALFALALTAAGAALAHDPYTGWTQPGTGASCCNQMALDRSSGDCRPIRARLDGNGVWWVLLDTGWRPVPRARILQQASPDLSSHVCANLTTEEIYCFVAGPQGS